MSHWGIGPKFSLLTLPYVVMVGYFVRANPLAFPITVLPRLCLMSLGSIFVITGAVVYVWALVLLRKGRRGSVLVTSGPYAVVRHPIYAAWILLVGPGVAVMLGSWLALTVPAVAYGAFKAFVREEDDHLQSVFGDAYCKYREHTGELFPSWAWRRTKGSDQ